MLRLTEKDLLKTSSWQPIRAHSKTLTEKSLVKRLEKHIKMGLINTACQHSYQNNHIEKNGACSYCVGITQQLLGANIKLPRKPQYRGSHERCKPHT